MPSNGENRHCPYYNRGMNCKQCNRDNQPMGPAPGCHDGCDYKKRKDCCAVPEPIQCITQPDSKRPGLVRFNYGGHSVDFDFTNLVQQVQTDTSLSINQANRTMDYNAERHIDSFSASELGSILHVGDLGDVDITRIKNNSLLFYQQDSNCGQGCEGLHNSWTTWSLNDTNGQTGSLQSVLGFDSVTGAPRGLEIPAKPNQFYSLGWNAQDKLGYIQPAEFTSFPYDTDGYAWITCVDPTTRQLGYVKVKKGTAITV